MAKNGFAALSTKLAASLTEPVSALPGIGPTNQQRLARLGVHTVVDLLHYFPRRYDDLRQVMTVADLQQFGNRLPTVPVTIRGRLHNITTRRTRRGKTVANGRIGNKRGYLEVIWFNQPYLAKQLVVGRDYLFSGKLADAFGRVSLQSPAVESAEAAPTHTARLVPIYPETEGLSSKWLRARIKPLLQLAAQVPEDLPADLIARQRLLPMAEALTEIHFPSSVERAQQARYRFDLAQLLLLQLVNQINRTQWQAGASALPVHYDPGIVKRFLAGLPWSLTDDQRRALHEILVDLAKPQPMLRLLEGEVGSGKTVVAAAAAYQAVASGYQAALMAPTEVLAEQHYQQIAAWFNKLHAPIVCLLGSSKPADKQRVVARLTAGEPLLIVGTHALIQDQVGFQRLALAVVDEQHRFGVAQREQLRGQHPPHLLAMTATPIPRSLALLAYGDQDLSVIASKPGRRPPVTTKLVAATDRPALYQEVAAELAAGRQVFIVVPVIESSAAGLRSLQHSYTDLSRGPLAGFSLGMLHGKLPTAEKTETMQRFAAGKLDALIATTVVEVGIDVPNATVMVIEEAQQFGLAQLHQLRGRVGRGSHQSFCYVVAGTTAAEDSQRLQAMMTHDSGFALAELDLQLRGPGDLLGTKQSGFELSVAALSDPGLLTLARREAAALLAADPTLITAPVLADRLRHHVAASATVA